MQVLLSFIAVAAYLFTKVVRDYVMDWEYGQKSWWMNSVFDEYVNGWFESYLLDEPETFIAQDPPKLVVLLLYNDTKKRFRSGIDGWHQLDGIMFMIFYAAVYFNIFSLNILSLIFFFVTIFAFWYEYFNLLFHYVLRLKGYRQIEMTIMKWFINKGDSG